MLPFIVFPGSPAKRSTMLIGHGWWVRLSGVFLPLKLLQNWFFIWLNNWGSTTCFEAGNGVKIYILTNFRRISPTCFCEHILARETLCEDFSHFSTSESSHFLIWFLNSTLMGGVTKHRCIFLRETIWVDVHCNFMCPM